MPVVSLCVKEGGWLHIKIMGGTWVGDAHDVGAGGHHCQDLETAWPLQLSRSDHRVRSSSGISGFGDLGQDYEVGFRRGVVPRREIDHVRRHVTRGMTSEDNTSQT